MKRLALFILTLYKYLLSPFLGTNCRFQPTCSEYAKEAIEKHGAIKGGWLALKRISHCHPFGKPGIDNVPEK